MKVVYQTSINSLRQKEQAIVKDGWQKIGIETELKSVDAGVFFSATPATPTPSATSTPTSRCSPRRSTRRSRSLHEAVLQRESRRGRRPEVEQLVWPQLPELDQRRLQQAVTTRSRPRPTAEAQQLWMKMNDLVVNNYVTIPLIDRKNADGKVKGCKARA